MRKLKLTALLLCAVMALPAVGCGNKTKSTSSRNTLTQGDEPMAESPSNVYAQREDIGVEEKVVDIEQEATANETGFTINRIIAVTPEDNNQQKYVYFDVNIKNDTDVAYKLSVLNNFYLIDPNENEIYGDIRTELYANSHFNNYFLSPFEIPANGEFKGIVGGFVIDASVDKFTVGFFPTKDNERNKASVIKVEATPENIEVDPADIMK